MTPTRLLALALCAAPLVTGCASIGTNYNTAAVAELTPGMAKAKVITLLGRPNTTVSLADGIQHVTWLYSHGSMFGAKARSLTLLFGPDGTYRQLLPEAATELR